MRACIFAHYDRENIVDEYVYFYLLELLTVVQKLVFVTVSDISIEDIKRLEKLNIDVIKRKNIGYDFYSYKVGIESFEFEQYDQLIICNESVFGPIYPLIELFDVMDNKICDFWGITESKSYSYHLQSYFICYRKTVLTAEFFHDFWLNLKAIEDKKELISAYEIGLSQLLYSNELKSEVFINYQPTIIDKNRIFIKFYIPEKLRLVRLFKIVFLKNYWEHMSGNMNLSIGLWDILISYHGMPFLKKSLFLKKIGKHDVLQNYQNIIGFVSKYPIELIKNYIMRLESK